MFTGIQVEYFRLNDAGIKFLQKTLTDYRFVIVMFFSVAY